MIKAIFCHEGDAPGIQTLTAVTFRRRHGSYLCFPSVAETSLVRGGLVYRRQEVVIAYEGTEADRNIRLVILPKGLSKASVMESEELRYDEVLYVTGYRLHEQWLIEELGASGATHVFIKPGSRHREFSGFSSAFVINDVNCFPDDPELAAVRAADFAKQVVQYVYGPVAKTKRKKRRQFRNAEPSASEPVQT
jgi:hypothetical protein